jgi:hypothetical protein
VVSGNFHTGFENRCPLADSRQEEQSRTCPVRQQEPQRVLPLAMVLFMKKHCLELVRSQSLDETCANMDMRLYETRTKSHRLRIPNDRNVA